MLKTPTFEFLTAKLKQREQIDSVLGEINLIYDKHDKELDGISSKIREFSDAMQQDPLYKYAHAICSILKDQNPDAGISDAAYEALLKQIAEICHKLSQEPDSRAAEIYHPFEIDAPEDAVMDYDDEAVLQSRINNAISERLISFFMENRAAANRADAHAQAMAVFYVFDEGAREFAEGADRPPDLHLLFQDMMYHLRPQDWTSLSDDDASASMPAVSPYMSALIDEVTKFLNRPSFGYAKSPNKIERWAAAIAQVLPHFGSADEFIRAQGFAMCDEALDALKANAKTDEELKTMLQSDYDDIIGSAVKAVVFKLHRELPTQDKGEGHGKSNP